MGRRKSRLGSWRRRRWRSGIGFGNWRRGTLRLRKIMKGLLKI
jgi:hypothetical protein